MILRTVRILNSNLNVYGSRSLSVDRCLTFINRNCCTSWLVWNSDFSNDVIVRRTTFSILLSDSAVNLWCMSFTLRLSYSNFYRCMILRTILIRNGYRNIESTRMSAIWNSLSFVVNSNTCAFWKRYIFALLIFTKANALSLPTPVILLDIPVFGVLL